MPVSWPVPRLGARVSGKQNRTIKGDDAMGWRKSRIRIRVVFRMPISFQAAEDVMYFEPAILNKPLPGRTPELSGVLEDLASASIRRLTSAQAITEEVRDAIYCAGPLSASFRRILKMCRFLGRLHN